MSTYRKIIGPFLAGIFAFEQVCWAQPTRDFLAPPTGFHTRARLPEADEDEQEAGRKPGAQATSSVISIGPQAADQIDYLASLPVEVCSIVQQSRSFSHFEHWLDEVFSALQVGAQLPAEDLRILEELTLLFGFESKPDQGLLASKGSILKNMQVSTEDKERIWQIFYNPSQYESNKDLGEVVTQIYVALSGITGPGSRVVLFDRIKQYKSILLKLANVVSRLDNTPRVAVPDAETLIARAIALGDQIAADPIANFDDLIGFNVIIDDTDLDESGRSEALTNYSARVESLLSSHPELRISKIRKESRAPGFEAINLYVQGWLNHRNFGDLSIKIQFRFKTAMYRESAMYYSYKTYGRWEMPPWASKISFGEIKSFRELQQELVTNFKTYVAGVKSPARFSIGDRLQMPPGWPSSMDLYDLALTNDPDTSSSDENAAVEKLDFLGRQV